MHSKGIYLKGYKYHPYAALAFVSLMILFSMLLLIFFFLKLPPLKPIILPILLWSMILAGIWATIAGFYYSMLTIFLYEDGFELRRGGKSIITFTKWNDFKQCYLCRYTKPYNYKPNEHNKGYYTIILCRSLLSDAEIRKILAKGTFNELEYKKPAYFLWVFPRNLTNLLVPFISESIPVEHKFYELTNAD